MLGGGPGCNVGVLLIRLSWEVLKPSSKTRDHVARLWAYSKQIEKLHILEGRKPIFTQSLRRILFLIFLPEKH